MRLKKRDLMTVWLKKRRIVTDDEGAEIITFDETGTKVEMTVQSAGGQVNASVYGSKLPYIKSCKYQGSVINEGRNELDGICLYVSETQEPDYQIKSIQTFSKHKNIILERMER